MLTSRREFLKSSLGSATLLALSGPAPGFLCRTARAAGTASERGHVLVVIQLSGGNDGLNTVVPYEDDAYHRGRPTLRLGADRVLKLEDGLGLHPDMPAFLRLYREGHLSIVQGVGYPNSNRDHDRAKLDWHTARPAQDLVETGWLGRAIDGASDFSRGDVPGVFVGSIRTPFGLHAGKAVVPSVRSIEEWRLVAPEASSQSTLLQHMTAAAQASPADQGGPAHQFLRSVTLGAAAASARLETVRRSALSGARRYPEFTLAQDLKQVAQLIRAELGIRIYCVEQGGGQIGGFDTHAGQAINHGALLRELSESIAAFVDDLRRDGVLDSVLVMTFSEFGRTLSENGRRGTDHGAAAPIFLAGGRLNQRLVGAHPSLTDLDHDAPKFHTDFRRVYATVLDRWLGFDSQPILGARFAALEGLVS